MVKNPKLNSHELKIFNEIKKQNKNENLFLDETVKF